MHASWPAQGGRLSRRALLGAGAAAGGLWLTGCGSGTSGGADRIQFWSQLAGSKKQAGLDLEEAFRQSHPETRLDTSLYGSPDQLNQKLLTGIVGGLLPDLFVQHWDYSITYASGDKLAPMSTVVDPDELDPRFSALSTFGGELATAPLYGTTRALTINVEHAERAGLDPTSPPKTWDDLRVWGRAMTARDGDRLNVAGFHLYGNDLELFEIFMVLLQGAGGALLSPDGQQVSFASDAGIAAVEFLRQLLLTDRVTTAGFGIGDSALGSPFSSGRAGMTLNGNYGLTSAEKGGVDLVVAPFPGRAGGYTSLIDPFSFGVPAEAAGRAAAEDFVRFAMSREQQAAFSLTSRNVPALLSAQSDPRFAEDEHLQAFIRCAQYAPENTPTTPVFTRFVPAVSRAIQNVFYERDDPAPALLAAAAQLQPLVGQAARG